VLTVCDMPLGPSSTTFHPAGAAGGAGAGASPITRPNTRSQSAQAATPAKKGVAGERGLSCVGVVAGRLAICDPQHSLSTPSLLCCWGGRRQLDVPPA
jgi:hypothetical protein